jgi:hypothetical protein
MAVALAAAAALLLAPPSVAELRAGQPVDEVAADLAYGLCPQFLAGALPLTSSELTDRGFSATVSKQPHPRFGELSMVGAKRPDGEIGFGGAAGKVCTVAVQGPKLPAVLARLKSSMRLMGLPFTATRNLTPDVPGIKVETFKAPIDKQILYLQLIDAGGPKPSVLAQLFVMDK